MKILLPKTAALSRDIDTVPLFFLGGPVRGGGDWQSAMCAILEELSPECVAAIPCRWGQEHPLYSKRLEGTPDAFPRQRKWERHYLSEAARGRSPGCIIFWLGEQKGPRPSEDGPYAQDTYGELGEWRGQMMYNPALRVVVGGEENFPGFSTIQGNFEDALGADKFTMYRSIREVTEAGVKRAQKSPAA